MIYFMMLPKVRRPSRTCPWRIRKSTHKWVGPGSLVRVCPDLDVPSSHRICGRSGPSGCDFRRPATVPVMWQDGQDARPILTAPCPTRPPTLVPLKRAPPPRSRPITDHLLDRFCFLTARDWSKDGNCFALLQTRFSPCDSVCVHSPEERANDQDTKFPAHLNNAYSIAALKCGLYARAGSIARAASARRLAEVTASALLSDCRPQRGF